MPYRPVLILEERSTRSKEESKITLDNDASSNQKKPKTYTTPTQKGKPNIKTIC